KTRVADECAHNCSDRSPAWRLFQGRAPRGALGASGAIIHGLRFRSDFPLGLRSSAVSGEHGAVQSENPFVLWPGHKLQPLSGPELWRKMSLRRASFKSRYGVCKFISKHEGTAL